MPVAARPASWLLALLLLLGLAPRARAGEEEQARELLERARVAEVVEHDPARALALYREAAERSGRGPAALLALLAQARLHEARGEASLAIAALERATQHAAAHMDEAQKRAVHDALLRLLPPGSRARSPLAEIVVRAPEAGPAAASPLERKIDDLLSQLDGSDALTWQERNNLEQNLRRALSPLGQDALPVLARIVRGARPERARFAATLLAGLGGPAAVDALVEAVAEGDGFTRAAALAGLEARGREDEDGAARLLAGLARLRAQPEVERQYGAKLLSLEARHAPAAEALARHLAGDTETLIWLDTALLKGAPGALDRVLALAAEPGPVGDRALGLLGPRVFPRRKEEQPLLRPEDLPAPVLQRMFEAHLRLPLDGPVPEVLARLARLLGSRQEPAARAESAAAAWGRLLEPEGNHSRLRSLAWALSESGIPIPLELASDPAFVDAIAAHGRWPQDGQRLLSHGQPFWTAFLDAVRRAPKAADAERLLQAAHSIGESGLPPALDARWFEVLDAPAISLDEISVPLTIWRALMRSGDERLLVVLRGLDLPLAAVPVPAARHQNLQAAISALPECPLELRLRICRELLGDERFSRQVPQILGVLAGAGPQGRALVHDFARQVEHSQAHRAVHLLGSAEDAPVVIGLCEALAARETLADLNPTYRHALIAAADRLHLKEAFPYLLREFREGLASENAGKAMTSIREYHERLAEFEAFAAGRAPAARGLGELLADPDPEIRRAAVLALAALGRKEASAELVRLAKEDPSPRVREAALSAVERLSK